MAACNLSLNLSLGSRAGTAVCVGPRQINPKNCFVAVAQPPSCCLVGVRDVPALKTETQWAESIDTHSCVQFVYSQQGLPSCAHRDLAPAPSAGAPPEACRSLTQRSAAHLIISLPHRSRSYTCTRAPTLAMRGTALRVGVLFLASAGYVHGHGHVIIPPPRNSIDARDQPLFANGAFPQTNGEPGCTEDMQVCGCWCANGTSPCDSGQTCYWFSQGCTIGCDTCSDVPKASRSNTDLCNSGLNATVCDPRLRTYNMNATCNGPHDMYRWNPWRYPGSAPVQDPCGKAGGGGVLVNNTGSARVGFGAAFFIDTVHAKANDLGSQVLPPMPTGTVWRAGERVEAMWGLRANHGGG